LPGLDGTGRLLHRQPRLFKEYDVRCIAYPHTPQTYQQLAALGEAELEQTGSATVLAESFGGAVALTLALKRPDLVRRLVLVNTFAYYPTRWVIHPVAWASYLFLPRPSPSWSRWFRSFFFFDPSIPESERQEWWELTADVPMTAFAYRLQMLSLVDLRTRLPEITTPTLVLAAPNDRVVPPSAGLLLARRLPHARFVRPVVGHAAMIHPAVDVAQLLERWEQGYRGNSRRGEGPERPGLG
jgi:3-oxoadipate enol-lactonase